LFIDNISWIIKKIKKINLLSPIIGLIKWFFQMDLPLEENGLFFKRTYDSITDSVNHPVWNSFNGSSDGIK